MERENRITGVFGIKGCGKTSLCKILTLRNDKPAAIIDYCGEYAFPIVKTVAGFLKYFKTEPRLSIRLVSHSDIERVLGILSRLERVLVVCDEVDAYASPHYIPEGLAFIARYGRHRSIDLIYASRRPAEVPRLLTSQSDDLFAFLIREQRDIAYLSEFTTTDLALLRNLSPLHYRKIL